jgi:phosphoadenosine phosphosulfate reductase
VTPPGDARPAFPEDIALINRIYEDHFGAPLIPAGHLALLNKVPDHDRMEEIVVGGGIAGIIRYLPKQRRWEPIPRPEACILFTPKKRFVIVDDGAIPFIRDQGMSVLAPGLISIDDAVCAGDEVFVLTKDGSSVGVGRAKVDAATARSMTCLNMQNRQPSSSCGRLLKKTSILWQTSRTPGERIASQLCWS